MEALNLRLLVAMVLGAITAFALFWVMQALIGTEGELKEGGGRLSVDYVRLKRDNTPQLKKREPPKREKPKQQPPTCSRAVDLAMPARASSLRNFSTVKKLALSS